MTDWGKSIICDFTFPVCNRTLRFTVAADYKCCDPFVYYITVYNGYKPRQNGELHKKIFYVSQERFYRLLNAHGKKLGLNFYLRRIDMTDRFKFRVWFDGRFIYKSLCDSNVYTEDDKCICLANILPDLHWEQCTGLKDKNGRLIYDGDIVEFDGDFHGDIAWDEDAGCWAIRTTENTIYTFDNLYGYELEVVGNIHENKEIIDD